MEMRKKQGNLACKVDLHLKAPYNNWWSYIIKESDPAPFMSLPHPKDLGVNAALFMDLYLPEYLKKENYSRITLVNPQNPMVKCDRKPSKFQRFYESLKAAGTNSFANLLRCIKRAVCPVGKWAEQFALQLGSWKCRPSDS